LDVQLAFDGQQLPEFPARRASSFHGWDVTSLNNRFVFVCYLTEIPSHCREDLAADAELPDAKRVRLEKSLL
jgi:hypothetical protein